MAQGSNGDERLALISAAKVAFVTFCGAVCAQMAKATVNRLFEGEWRVDWKLVFFLSVLASAVIFIWTLISVHRSLRSLQPAFEVLNRDPSTSMTSEGAISGFVGMEYYGLILNRTYLVFAATRGFYGWKVEGPVSAENPQFYKPYEEMLEDPELMRDLGAIEELAKLKSGFFIPRSDIASVKISEKSKWGMGGIPHSGRVRIELAGGRSREFILLGSVSPEEIRDKVMASLGS